MSAHSETPIASAQELDELTRLRVELSYLDWKAHPRHRTERVLREAQRQWGVPEREALFWSGLLPSGDDSSTAPTIHPLRTSAPTFSDATPCDATLTIDTSAAPAWPMRPVRLNRRERRARRFAR